MANFQRTAEEAELLSRALGAANTAQGGTFAKSFTTGDNVVLPGDTGGAAVRVQDLATDVKNITYGRNDFVMFNLIPRGTALSTAHEYTIQDGYGVSGSSRFVREMEIADVNDVSLERKVVTMKIISDTRQVSILSMQVKNLKDPMQVELDAAMLTIAKSIEYAIFYGDADLASKQGQGAQFDGLKKLIDPNNVIDLRGEILTERDLNAASVRIAEAFGNADSAFMPIGVHAAFVQNQLNRQWITQGSAEAVASGFTVPKFIASQGQISLYPSTIMRTDKILDTKQAISAQAPAAPVVTATVDTDANSKFAAEDAGTLEYAVVLESDNSTASAPASVTAVAEAGKSVNLTINLGIQVIGNPRNVSIYRFDEDSKAYFLLDRVPFYKATNESGSFVIKFTDANQEIPGTSEVFVGELNDNVLELLELATLQRFPLAQVKAAYQFSVLWQGGLALYAPKKWVMLKNVKARIL